MKKIMNKNQLNMFEKHLQKYAWSQVQMSINQYSIRVITRISKRKFQGPDSGDNQMVIWSDIKVLKILTGQRSEWTSIATILSSSPEKYANIKPEHKI